MGAAGDPTRVSLEELVGLRLDLEQRPGRRLGPARSPLAGAHRSAFRGRGMDYLESRAYQAGDDVRNMDWRVTARTGQAHVKLYHEERERPVILVTDLSPTTFFASRGALKSVVLARAAALLAWWAAGHGDRVGGLVVAEGRYELRPRGGRHGVLRLLHALVSASDPGRLLEAGGAAGGLEEALSRLRRVTRPGSLVVILSDFHGLAEVGVRALERARLHSEVLACRVWDRLEREPPPPGRYPVTDGRRRGLLDTRDPAVRAAYEAFFAERDRYLREVLRRLAAPLLDLDTADDPVARIGAFLGRGR